MRHHQTLFSILVLATMLISCEKEMPESIPSPVAQPPVPGRLLAAEHPLQNLNACEQQGISLLMENLPLPR